MGGDRFRGADAAIQLGARFGGEAGAVVHERGGAIGVELPGAQLGCEVLEALDQRVEAVELAKEYCGADAPGFVNGILGAAVREGAAVGPREGGEA